MNIQKSYSAADLAAFAAVARPAGWAGWNAFRRWEWAKSLAMVPDGLAAAEMLRECGEWPPVDALGRRRDGEMGRPSDDETGRRRDRLADFY